MCTFAIKILIYHIIISFKYIFVPIRTKKKRTTLARNTVAQLFIERIEPVDDRAKLANVWRIKHVWRALKEQIRRKVFATLSELEKDIKKEWKSFLKEKCEKNDGPNTLSVTTGYRK